MKKIGKGWQYDVYDLRSGRVRKVPRSMIAQYLSIFSDCFFKFGVFSFAEAFSELARVNAQAKASNQYVIKNLPFFGGGILGNPKFLSDLSYEQDRARMLGELVSSCALPEASRYIDQYIDLIHGTWRFGFADCIYNFTINNGIGVDGKMIQVDFGELTFSKEDVARQIESKRWLKSYSYVSFPDGELKDYYRTQMDEQMTLENLNLLWGAQHKG